jgi:hypothetical protein
LDFWNDPFGFGLKSLRFLVPMGKPVVLWLERPPIPGLPRSSSWLKIELKAFTSFFFVFLDSLVVYLFAYELICWRPLESTWSLDLFLSKSEDRGG